MELRSAASWPPSFFCPPKCWHRAVLPQLQPGLSLPLPMARPDVPTGSSKPTVLSHLHTFAHVKLPPPQLPPLKAKSTWSTDSEARPQPAATGPLTRSVSPGSGSAQLPQEEAQPWRRGRELICTPLRLGKGLAWGQHNRYLICSSPSGSDGYWNMVMGVV